MANCPVCGMTVDEKSAPSMEHNGKKYYFMDDNHRGMFKKDPEKFLNRESHQSKHKSM